MDPPLALSPLQIGVAPTAPGEGDIIAIKPDAYLSAIRSASLEIPSGFLWAEKFLVGDVFGADRRAIH
jgi:hypothetical protein